MASRYKRRKGNAQADASESVEPERAVTSRNAGGNPDTWAILPLIGGVDLPSVSSPDGFNYRNNVLYPSNQDRIEVHQRHRQLSLTGSHKQNTAAAIAGSQLEGVESRFWPDLYMMLHEMAQYKDGYRSIDAALDTALRAMYRDEYDERPIDAQCV